MVLFSARVWHYHVLPHPCDCNAMGSPRFLLLSVSQCSPCSPCSPKLPIASAAQLRRLSNWFVCLQRNWLSELLESQKIETLKHKQTNEQENKTQGLRLHHMPPSSPLVCGQHQEHQLRDQESWGQAPTLSVMTLSTLLLPSTPCFHTCKIRDKNISSSCTYWEK